MNLAPPPIVALIAELPMYLFFSLFCLVLLKWYVRVCDCGTCADLYYSTNGRISVVRKGSNSRKLPQWMLYIIVAIANLVLYIFFAIFLIIFSVRRRGVSENSKCMKTSSISSGDHAERAVAIAYHVMVAALALGFALAFLAYGSLISVQLVQLGVLHSSNRMKFFQVCIRV